MSGQWRHTGADAGREAPQLENLPGQDALRFRLGTAAQFQEELLRRLRTAGAVTAEGRSWVPFADVADDPRADWTTALLRSWAETGDILSFYQERRINEGFLRTAREAGSLDLLLWGLGVRRGAVAVPGAGETATAIVRLDPGCAATADLLFSVAQARGMPARVALPGGSLVRSVSPSGSEVAFLETDRAAVLRREWNAMPAHRPVPVPATALRIDAPGVLLSGIVAGLRPGDPVLIVGTGADGGVLRLLRTVTSVLPLRTSRLTEVTWVPAAGDPGGTGTVESPRLYRFDRRVSLFGSDAPVLATLSRRRRLEQGVSAGGVAMAAGSPEPDATLAWRRLDDGLPAGTFTALLAMANGTVVLGTDDGVFVRNPDDPGWNTARAGMTQRTVATLASGPDGAVLAGTTNGGVFRSENPARGWDSLAGGFVMSRSGRRPVPAKAALPNEVVRRLAYVAHFPGGPGIVALTDSGLYVQQTVGVWLRVTLKKPVAGRCTDFLFGRTKGAVVLCHTGGVEWTNVTGTTLLSAPEAGGAPPADAAPPPASKPARASRLASFFQGLRREEQAVVDWFDKRVLHLEDGSVRLLGNREPVALAPLSGRLGDGEVLVATNAGALVAWEGKLSEASAGLPKAKSGEPVALQSLDWALTDGGLSVLGVAGPGADGQGAGLYRYGPEERRWTLVVPADAAAGPLLVSVAGDGPLVTAQTPVPAQEWPGFALSTPPGGPAVPAPPGDAAAALDLDSPTLALAPGSMAVLTDPTAGRMAAGSVLASYPETAEGFSLQGRVCRAWVALPAGTDLDGYGRRSAQVYAASEELVAVGLDATLKQPVGPGTALALDGLVSGLATGPEEADAVSVAATAPATPLRTARQTPTRQLRTAIPAVTPSSTVPAAALPHAALPPSAAPSPAILAPAALSPAGWPGGPAPRRIAVSGRAARVLPAVLGGVLALAASGSARPARALPYAAVAAFARIDATLVAGCADGALHRSTDGISWSADPAGAPGICAGLTALAARDGTLWAAGPGGVAARGPEGTWSPAPALPGGREAACLLPGADGTLWAGTGGGLYALPPGGTAWQPQAGGALDPDVAVTALAAAADGAVLVGTDGDGVLRLAPGGGAWTVFCGPIGNGRVSALAVDGTRVLAGTPEAGAFLSAMDASFWRPAGTDPTLAVSAVAVSGPLQAVAGGGGVSWRRSEADGWSRAPLGLAGDVGCLLAPAGEGLPLLLAGAMPRLPLSGGADGGMAAALTLAPVATLPASAPSLLAAGVLGPELRFALAQANVKPADDAELGVLPGGRGWTLGGATAPPLLLVPMAQGVAVLRSSQPPLRAVAARLAEAATGRLDLTLVPDTGGSVSAQAYGDELLYLPSTDRDPTLAVTRDVVASVAAGDGSRTDVVLGAATGLVLDPATVSACANVVGASQGRSVLDEVLGDGDGTATRQRFRLRQAPLTFLPGAAPGERVSTVAVAVDGVLWREMPTLADCGPADLVYTVTVQGDGGGLVTFGDGVQGARLPTGRGNVRASYRTGMGALPQAGSLDQQPLGATSLAHLMAGSGGLSKDVKLVPGTPAVPPTDATRSRETLPRQAVATGRLVTPADYARLLSRIPGVSKVRTDDLALPGARPVLFVTVAAGPGTEGAPTPALMSTLRATLHANRAAGARRAELAPCEELRARLAVRLWLAPGRSARDAVAAGRSALLARFGFAGRALAAPLAADGILAVLQAVPGVAGVELLRLHREDEPERCCGEVPALPARFEAGACRAAQLVCLHDDPRMLSVVAATLGAATPGAATPGGEDAP